MTIPIYVESSVVSYHTARPSNDPTKAHRRAETQRWWREERAGLELFVSEFVLAEISRGDPEAAAVRLKVVEGWPLLEATPDAQSLAKLLVAGLHLPDRAAADAAHMAVASVHGMHFLLTWNNAHIANAYLRPRIEQICRDFGAVAPIMCSPEELRHA
jgi:predicted nucleic acid-binding protein